ncbi:MAG: S4 domain-containing protein, partial [Candidatus Puniceispirillaceae bacterium]
MAETLTLKTDDETPRQRLDRWLAENSGIEALSRSRIKNLILDGQLSCNGQPETDPSSVVRGRAVYQLTLPEAAAALPEAEDIALDIL